MLLLYYHAENRAPADPSTNLVISLFQSFFSYLKNKKDPPPLSSGILHTSILCFVNYSIKSNIIDVFSLHSHQYEVQCSPNINNSLQ